MLMPRIRLAAASAATLVVIFALAAGVASAHAQYSNSTPAANATLSDAPTTLQITFTEELSDIRIAVTGPDGSAVATGPATFDLAHRKNASVALRGAGPGTYTVVWHNVSSDDGDPNDGSFVFTVAGSAPTQTGTASQPTTPAPTAQAPAPTCLDNGVKTPGINDVRVDTYCKRQAIRDKFRGQIDEASFNADLADGKGLESALADAMADFQKQHRAH